MVKMGDEEELAFDPSLKKKKKSKKGVAAFEEGEGDEGGAGGGGTPQQVEDTAVGGSPSKGAEEKDDLSEFSAKKKKKKKKVFNMDELDAALPEGETGARDSVPAGDGQPENGSTAAGGGAAADADMFLDDDNLDFNLPKKKKKKKKINIEDAEAGEEVDDQDMGLDDGDRDGEAGEGTAASSGGGFTPWANSDRDYTYEELLTHVFNIIKEKNPDIIAGEKRRLVLRPPQVLRVGTKKSSFANFLEICKSLHRPPKHMQAFLLAELGTSGSVDANNQLIIKGRFQQKQIESVLRRYIKEYVACQTCRSPETILQKDTRLSFLQCETCGSRRSVASIKSGFQAVTGKRAAIRAKTA